MHINEGAGFMGITRTFIYADKDKVENKTSPFQVVQRKKARTNWQMKNHTF